MTLRLGLGKPNPSVHKRFLHSTFHLSTPPKNTEHPFICTSFIHKNVHQSIKRHHPPMHWSRFQEFPSISFLPYSMLGKAYICVYTCVYIFISIHLFIHLFIILFVKMCEYILYKYMSIYIYMYVYIYIYVIRYLHTHIYMIKVYVMYMLIYIYIHMYTYIRMYINVVEPSFIAFFFCHVFSGRVFSGQKTQRLPACTSTSRTSCAFPSMHPWIWTHILATMRDEALPTLF